jgi:dimethylamine/trimethylamine dehydrogenase
MSRDPRFDILFEPVAIGPVTARNRFYQAPHCNGMGRNYPSPMAAMRGTKAEGGWAVVFTELADIHHTSDSPRNVRLWDKEDFPILAPMVERVHEHGSLAGIQLAHLGFVSANLIGRETPLAPTARHSYNLHPASARAMDRSDIRAYRGWHRAAALNARAIGYDIVMIYAAHDMGLPMHFLSRRHNKRDDDYGGALANRARLLRELIEDTRDAVGDRCAVGVRLCVDDLGGPGGVTSDGDGAEAFALLAELPDYWDLSVGKWPDDSATSRFREEGFQEPYIAFARKLTTKPIVGVGRFTSPDTMVSQIRRGVLDMIGAARPSIADPFLPRKIEEGRPEDIRECIGCNICITNNHFNTPIRCTQNPTMGEEWRRGWHPERMPARTTQDRILIVGSGPAGLEAARALGLRGYEVMIAEAANEAGGRVSRESRLPGLGAWSRVRDYRLQQISGMSNVSLYLGSRMGAQDVRETGSSLVALATGSHWRRDGVGRQRIDPLPELAEARILTPDDIMDGVKAAGHVVVYDDDHYYMASVVAEKLVADGCRVTMVTPGATVARYTEYTLEIGHIHKRLYGLGIEIVPNHALDAVRGEQVVFSSVYTSAPLTLSCDAVVLVTGQAPDDRLLTALAGMDVEDTSMRVVAIGDCRAPSTIAAAVYSGHRFARELGLDLSDSPTFTRENVLPAHHPGA